VPELTTFMNPIYSGWRNSNQPTGMQM
jgi:hypothetical protein